MKIAVVLCFAVVMICASGGKKIGMSVHQVVIAALKRKLISVIRFLVYVLPLCQFPTKSH